MQAEENKAEDFGRHTKQTAWCACIQQSHSKEIGGNEWNCNVVDEGRGEGGERLGGAQGTGTHSRSKSL